MAFANWWKLEAEGLNPVNIFITTETSTLRSERATLYVYLHLYVTIYRIFRGYDRQSNLIMIVVLRTVIYNLTENIFCSS